MNILEEIAEKTRERVKTQKQERPLFELRAQAEMLAHLTSEKQIVKDGHSYSQKEFLPFEQALRTPGMSFICEIKKASPSKSVIAEHFPYLAIAKEYEEAGAAAISCLTEPFWFQGDDRYLREISKVSGIPVLRKDFTVDDYMIYQSKVLGASAILLICSLLDDSQLKNYIILAQELGLSALTEAHTQEEVERALNAGANIIGVNNRDLKTFTVNLDVGLRLRKMVPDDICFVSESGIRTRDDIKRLYENGTDAVLIGETLMRAKDKKAMLDDLRGISHG